MSEISKWLASPYDRQPRPGEKTVNEMTNAEYARWRKGEFIPHPARFNSAKAELDKQKALLDRQEKAREILNKIGSYEV